MATYEVAHRRVQGVDVILVVVDSSFGNRSQSEQEKTQQALGMCAYQAGLRGTVAVLWDEHGRVGFFGPARWSGFLRSLTWPWVATNINYKLTCG